MNAQTKLHNLPCKVPIVSICNKNRIRKNFHGIVPAGLSCYLCEFQLENWMEEQETICRRTILARENCQWNKFHSDPYDNTAIYMVLWIFFLNGNVK